MLPNVDSGGEVGSNVSLRAALAMSGASHASLATPHTHTHKQGQALGSECQGSGESGEGKKRDGWPSGLIFSL